MSATISPARGNRTVAGSSVPGRGAFVVTAFGGLLVSLDVSVANSLLPAIGADFTSEGRDALSWVITGYAIVFAAVLVPAGRIADRAGRRRTFVGGLAVFAVGSLLCGVAPNLAVLLTGRSIQGIGSAAASPASLGLLLAACDDRHRAQYAARWTGAAAVGICLGPLVGGGLTTAGNWRWAFLVNLPIVAAMAFGASRFLVETPRHPGRRLPDPFGAVVFALNAAVLTLVLSEMTTWGALSLRTSAALGVAALLAAVFVVRSRRAREPMLDLALLRNRRVLVSAAVGASYAAGFFGFLLSFMLFFVGHWQLSLVQAGTAILAPGLVVILLTMHVGRWAERLGHRLFLVTGAALMSVALTASALVINGGHFEARWLVIGPLMGLGIGLNYPVLAGASVHGLPAADLAAASAINQCARQFGAAIGVAAAVGILGTDAVPGLASFHAAWVLGAAFCAVAGVAATFLPRIPRTA